MKEKGTRTERELIHMFWNTGTWIALRAAGSGSTTLPSPDILAGNGHRRLAIECKSLRGRNKYFSKDDLDQLRIFSKRFGAEPWVAIRFDREDWHFLPLHDLKKGKGNNFVVSLDDARTRGLSFTELVRF